MCTILCEESCLYELHMMEEKNVEKEKSGQKNLAYSEEGKLFPAHLIMRENIGRCF